MLTLMADHDVEGQMQVLLRLLTSAEWHAIWTELAVRVESFASLGVPTHTSDAALWGTLSNAAHHPDHWQSERGRTSVLGSHTPGIQYARKSASADHQCASAPIQ